MASAMIRQESKMFQQLVRADEMGVRREIVRGLPLWEAHPVLKHQRAIDRIRASSEPGKPAGPAGCTCAGMPWRVTYRP